MSGRIACVSLLVHEYDEAIAFFTGALRFQLVEDTPVAPGKRWVVVAPAGGGGALLLARAANDAQRAQVGRQAAGRVFLFLHTQQFDADLRHLREHGVHLAEEPRDEPYGRVVVFHDLYGNPWDLIEPRQAQPILKE